MDDDDDDDAIRTFTSFPLFTTQLHYIPFNCKAVRGCLKFFFSRSSSQVEIRRLWSMKMKMYENVPISCFQYTLPSGFRWTDDCSSVHWLLFERSNCSIWFAYLLSRHSESDPSSQQILPRGAGRIFIMEKWHLKTSATAAAGAAVPIIINWRLMGKMKSFLLTQFQRNQFGRQIFCGRAEFFYQLFGLDLHDKMASTQLNQFSRTEDRNSVSVHSCPIQFAKSMNK